MDRPPDFSNVSTPTVPSVTIDPSPQTPLPPSAAAAQLGGGGSTSDWPPTPPSEPVKLFIGQVPKTFDEKDLKEVIEPYSPIEGITILRDRVTGHHKGCAFVTFTNKEIADAVQIQLHDKVTLPTMSRPLQVNTAGTKTEELRKVFVGMLGKCTKEDVARMFQPFGPIEDLTMLQDRDGVSKRCAFIKFSTRQQAQTAINEMHGSSIMPGANAPLVVKYADTEKERQARRMQKAMQQFAQLSISAAATSPQFYGQQLPSSSLPMLYAQLISQNPMVASIPPPMPAYSPGPHQLLSPTSPTHGGSQLSTGTQPPVGTSGLASPGLPPGIGGPVSSSIGGLSPNGVGSTPDNMQSPIHSPLQPYSGLQTDQYGMYHHYTNPFTLHSPIPTPHHKEPNSGPEGCNLFIYHLPADYGDMDLVHLFQPYGNIVSAKVYIDKNTKQSKCFGFVSYDQAHSAAAAINHLNGSTIGSKRLKVEYKKPPKRQ